MTTTATDQVFRLTDMDTEEVSLVDRAANNQKFLVIKRDQDASPEGEGVEKAKTKTEGGQEFPASAYAYVPDSEKPSTWKLRLYESPGDSAPSATYTAAAAQALSPAGFRGNRVQIPAEDLAGVKAKVRAAWLKAHEGKTADDLPASLKKMHDSYWQLDRAADMASGIAAAISLAPEAPASDPLPWAFTRLIRKVQLLIMSVTGDMPDMPCYVEGDDYINASLSPVAPAIKAAVVKTMGDVAQALETLCDTMKAAEDTLPPEQAQTVASVQQALNQMLASFPVQKSEEPMSTLTAETTATPPAAPAAPAPAPAPASAAPPADTAKNNASAETPPVTTPAPVVPAAPAPTVPAADVNKVGAAMQADRLGRLKSVLSEIQTAVGSLLSGNLCMDDFKKCASGLQTIINELEVAKSLGARAGQRPTSPTIDTPNASNGVQLDPNLQADAGYVAGAGTDPSLADLLKTVQALKGDVAKRDAQIASLAAEVATVKKARVATSVPPHDPAPRTTAPAGGQPVFWPRDMSADRSRARR